MKRKLCCGLLICAALGLSGFTSTVESADELGKIKAATYYSDEWVINFWNSETNDMDKELSEIREDGFNTIIVCVPWREFQPLTVGGAYNDYAFEKLERIMKSAERNGLKVMLRLGYTWDYYDESDILKRYEELLYKTTTQNAWLSYAEKVYDTVSKYPSYAGAFLTWEDFWNFISVAENLTEGYNARSMARATGYADYAIENYSLEELTELHGKKIYKELIAFPEKDTDAYRIFLEFYDDWLNQLLEKTQEVFPDLSMEVRLDMDSYGFANEDEPDGGKKGFTHETTYGCGNASYSANMLSANMGFGTAGELLEAKSTAVMSEQILKRHAAGAGKPIFCDQFLFTDNTPGFEDNARLDDSEIDEYLRLMGPVFDENTIGYGVWTYRDYADNIVYNSQFALDLKGWKHYGGLSVETVEGTKMCRMNAGSTLTQELGTRNYISSENTKISMRVKADSEANIRIRLGQTETVVPVSGEMTVNIGLPKQERSTLSIHTDKDILIDDIKVYSHITRAGIYTEDGEEGAHLEAIRELNERLE